MVGQRKGAAPKPGVVVAIQAGKPGGPSGDSDDALADIDTCPNCGCEFDDDSGKIVKPGAKVVGGPKDYEGADLDVGDSAEPTPGKLGTAHDAALGDQVMGNLLANLKGGIR